MDKIIDTASASATVKCWVELYSDELYAWALFKTGKKEAAEDLLQEAFLSAFKSFSKFEGNSQPKTWLFAILNNLIAGYFRKKFKSPLIEEDINDTSSINIFFETDGPWKKEEQPKEWTDQQANLLDDTAFLKILNACMEKLPETWLTVVRLKYLEEKKGELICQELEITATNFWQILHRAKLQLRKCLEIHWFKK